ITWEKDGQIVAGATNDALFLTNISFAASGEYSVIVRTAFQTCTSPPVRITVVPLLASVTPASQAVRLGSNAVFTVSVNGVGPFEYQWQFNGQDLTGAQAATFAILNVQLTNEGSYQVVCANAYGTSTSDPANLVVLINPAVVIPPLSQRVVEGGNAIFILM